MTEESVVDKKQKLLIEYVISNRELFVKCVRILKPEYFEAPLDEAVEYVLKHFNKHKDIPNCDIIEAETGTTLVEREVDGGDIDYVSEELELFCQEQAMMNAVLDGVDLINEGNLQGVIELARQALLVKLDNSLGVDLFEDPYERIQRMHQDKDHRKIGLDFYDKIIGDIGRGELGVLAAPSGGGKSLGLVNIMRCLSKQKLHGVAITLELDEGLYSKRTDTIILDQPIDSHFEEAEYISEKLLEVAPDMGSIIIKRLPNGTTATDIRAYLMEYYVQRGHYPDYLIVDYIAGMGLEGMTNLVGVNKFDTDKYKSEALRDIMEEFSMYGFTAAQINREGQDVYTKMNASYIQGGMSLIQTSDWTIAMVQSDEDIDNNQFKCVRMKVRNQQKSSTITTGYMSPYSLQFSDTPYQTSKVRTKSSGGLKPKKGKTDEKSNPAASKLKQALNSRALK